MGSPIRQDKGTHDEVSPAHLGGQIYALSACRAQGLNPAQIARQLGRHRSTIGREVKRNSSRADGSYRPSKAIERTHGRRSRSRRNQRFTLEALQRVEALLRKQWSPEQVAGFLRRKQLLRISHGAIGLKFYFATPHHAGEHSTNENTNGLIRQYLPKRPSMAALTQPDRNVIAHKLNTRPRKRLDYQTPEECFYAH